MMYEGLQMDKFVRQLKEVISSLVVKRNKVASKYETLDIQREAERYVMAKDGVATYDSFVNFDYEVYKALGIPDQLIAAYTADKSKIPYGLRDTLVSQECTFIIANYVEKNNYYRMLAGLPDYDDKDYVYCPTNDIGISTTIPLHQLDSYQIGLFLGSPLYATVLAANPTKKYLNYLGTYSISYYSARKALNYELLYATTTDPENIAIDFRKYYANARLYYMQALYNPSFANAYTYYDNFIGLCMIIMAVQRTCAQVFQQGITRDFYDTQLVRYLFDSYNIPYITDMTLEQMKLLAKNLNIFLSLKSSTKVLFDICSIFGYSNINIYKYLLVRDHVKDSVTGDPIFPTHSVANGDGTYVVEPDYAKMYDIYFQKVDVETRDLAVALEDKTNKTDYATLIAQDPYWIDDSNLREKIYKATYNHIETKYISMDTMIHITAMMYEINHTFRMIIDNNAQFKNVSITLSKASASPMTLYTTIIYACALFCKKYGFTGEIPITPSSVAYVYGFNFHADIATIINDISKSEYIDSSIAKYLLNFSVQSTKDVDRIYSNIKALKDFVVEQMASTKDIEAYRAYKKLYNSILVVQDVPSVYTKSDGTYAKTYEDLLQDIDSTAYNSFKLIDTTDTNAVSDIMDQILYKLESLSSSYKYLHTAADVSSVFDVMVKLIKLFKSYTVNLLYAGILYIFDDRYMNMLKVLDGIVSREIVCDVQDNINLKFMDAIYSADVDYTLPDRMRVYDRVETHVYANLAEHIIFRELIESGTVESIRKDKLRLLYGDVLGGMVNVPMVNHIHMDDDILLSIAGNLQAKIKLLDKLREEVNSDVNDSMTLIDKEFLKYGITYNEEDRINLKETLGKMLIANIVTRMVLKDEYVRNVQWDIGKQFHDSIFTIINDAIMGMDVSTSKDILLLVDDQLAHHFVEFFRDETEKVYDKLLAHNLIIDEVDNINLSIDFMSFISKAVNETEHVRDEITGMSIISWIDKMIPLLTMCNINIISNLKTKALYYDALFSGNVDNTVQSNIVFAGEYYQSTKALLDMKLNIVPDVLTRVDVKKISKIKYVDALGGDVYYKPDLSIPVRDKLVSIDVVTS